MPRRRRRRRHRASRDLVPVAAADPARQSGYGRFPEHIERDWLGRWCHLSEADVSLARRRAGDVTRLGFAAQLVTVRAIGTFLADPTAVPAPIVASLDADSFGGQCTNNDLALSALCVLTPMSARSTVPRARASEGLG